MRLSGLEGTSNSPSKNKRTSTVSLDNFFSPEQDSSTSKRIKIDEDNFESPDTTLAEIKVLHLPELTTLYNTCIYRCVQSVLYVIRILLETMQH